MVTGTRERSWQTDVLVCVGGVQDINLNLMYRYPYPGVFHLCWKNAFLLLYYFYYLSSPPTTVSPCQLFSISSRGGIYRN